MKEIKGYEGLYAVTPNGSVWSYKSNIFLSPRPDSKGYACVSLRKNKASKTYRVHRLIAEAYIRNPFNKPQVNHKNGVKTDNRVTNLEWVLPKENINHAIKHGWIKLRKLNSVEVKEIRDKYLSGTFSQKELEEMYHIDQTNISRIIRRQSYKDVV